MAKPKVHDRWNSTPRSPNRLSATTLLCDCYRRGPREIAEYRLAHRPVIAYSSPESLASEKGKCIVDSRNVRVCMRENELICFFYLVFDLVSERTTDADFSGRVHHQAPATGCHERYSTNRRFPRQPHPLSAKAASHPSASEAVSSDDSL